MFGWFFDKLVGIWPAVILYSVLVTFTDLTHSDDALEKNQEMEFQRNRERFQFLKWGAKAFKNMLIVPPGSGIVHQVGWKVNSLIRCCLHH